ncbi:2-hydroxyacid dehydrogenase [Ramlibacter sp. WS9]|uniref:2-hydroxyacid dehydrogenase n=1 Tax=Ramlibacter sp. WS9 TaxID=1882741 RepID=UPI00114401D4|nr:2-hydroxyacid dehydrogenase [Ramlibacter sp. WS9]ROZ62263.1 2-hydroxyacid dehydrogenase [Ramlibacter sp. WS9]
MSRPRVLQAGPAMRALEAALAAQFDCHSLAKQSDPKRFLAEQGSTFEALVTSGKSGADGALMDALPALKAITHFGVGYDTVDVTAAAQRGIPVSNTPDVLNDCVADVAMGLLIDAARGLSASDRFVRRGNWLKGPFPLATRVSGKKLGIAGLGRIGQAIAKRAQGFDMAIRYHSRRPVAGISFQHEPSLAALADWCDFLVVIVSGGAATKHLVSADVIRALGPKGYLINVSRGSVVDEAALVDALVNKRIAGAGLDVFEDEPNVPQALMGLDNVVLLPHLASGTHETRQAMADLVMANLHSIFDTGKLLTPVPAPA